MQKALTGLLALGVALAAAAAFWGLGATSLWLDELATRYFADPAVGGAGAALARALEDVNSPLYYLVTWALQRVTGLEFVLAARGVAAAGAVGALGLLVFGRARGLSLLPRLVAAGFAVATPVWFDYAQEARAYGLALAFSMALGLLARGLLGGITARGLVAFAAVAVLAALNHYYALFVAGGLLAMLLLFSDSRRAAGAVVATGLAIVGLVGGFVAWHRPQMVLDIHDTWFSASPAFLSALTANGLAALFGGGLTITLAALGLAAFLLRWAGGKALALSVGGAVLTYLLALGVTLSFTPMISSRLFVVLAPLVWLALAEGVEVALRGGFGRLWGAGLAILALAALPAAFDRGRDTKQPWRASAAAVAALPGCTGATLPVIWLSDHFIRDDDPEWLYGFYLPPDAKRGWIALERRDLPQALATPALQDLVRQTASGARACPVLLWAVAGPVDDPKAAIATLGRALPPGAGRIEERVILAPDSGARAQIFVLMR